MLRRLVLAVAVVAVVVGMWMIVQPAAATGQQTVENGTAFEGSSADERATDTPRTDAPNASLTATDATPANRTAAGNAIRPAGTDPFGPTETTTTASGPEFGPVLAALALVALAVLLARRTR